MTNSTAQMLFLALTRPEGAPVGFGTDRDLAVAAGALVDLVEAGALHVTDGKNPRLELTAAASADAPHLQLFAPKAGKPVAKIVESVKKQVTKDVAADLAERGDVRIERRIGGLMTLYPLNRPEGVEELRRKLTDVVRGMRPGTGAQISALGIAHAAGSHKHLVTDAGMSGRDLGRRIDELMTQYVEAGGVARGVRSAVQAANAAVMAACAGAMAVSTS